MKYLSLFCASLFVGLALSAQTQVAVYGSDKSQVDGIAYRLPRNHIAVQVTAVKQTYTPGKYAQYAEELLKVSAPIGEEMVSWELAAVETRCIAVPDPEKVYFIKIADRTSASNVQLTGDGILLSVNTEVDLQLTDPLENFTPVSIPSWTKPKDPSVYYTTDIIQAASPSTVARLIAEEIYLLREKRNDLLRGELENMPKDGTSMQLILDNYKEQEDVLISVFQGTVVTERKTYTLYIEPNAEVEEQVLFRFSKKLGVVDADNMAGEPIYYSLVSKRTVADKTPRTAAELKRAARLQKDNEKRVPRGEPFLTEGIVYNVPERVDVTVYSSDSVFAKAEYRIAQMGNTDVLLNDLFNRRNTFRVIINPQDGSLLKTWQDEPTRR